MCKLVFSVLDYILLILPFRFDEILAAASSSNDSEFLLTVNSDENQRNLTLAVLHFTSLLIEYSFSRHLYSSVEVITTLLCCV